MYSREVDTIPLFKEKMVLISKQQMNSPLSVLDLNPQQEIRLPWHPEYDLWHNHWFSINANPLITIDQMPIMEYFLTQDNTWAITPYSVATAIKNKQNCYIYTLNEPPDDMIIYYLQPKAKPSFYALKFLSICKQELRQYEYFTLLS